MKILCLSTYLSSLDMLIRLRLELGQENVRALCRDGSADFEHQGDGLIDNVKGVHGLEQGIAPVHRDWADLIVVDNADMGRAADALRKSGKRVIGGSEWTDRLEGDRDFGAAQMAKAGINTPKSVPLAHCSDAIEYVRKHKGRWVLKPHDTKSDADLTYVSRAKGSEDLVAFLEASKGNAALGKPATLQQAIDGTEIGCTGFFDGTKFLSPHFLTFEYKRLAAGNLGPNTGEMGSVLFCTPKSALFDQTLRRMGGVLSKAGYAGPMNIGGMIEDGTGRFYGFEWGARFGYPETQILAEGLSGSWTQVLREMARPGGHTVSFQPGWYAGIAIVPSGFPVYEGTKKSLGRPILGINPENAQHVHLSGVSRDAKEKTFRVANPDGAFIVVTGAHHANLDAAVMEAYRTTMQVHFPGSWYRNDIGQSVKEAWPKIAPIVLGEGVAA